MSINALSLLTPEGRELQQNLGPLRVLGIDLGTTNSTVAEIVWSPDDDSAPVAHCIEVEQPTMEGNYTHSLVPSVVAIHQGREFVGEGAKRLRARAAELGLSRDRDLFFECKNEMGIRRSYHRAPVGYQSASDVGARVLDFLRRSAADSSPEKLTRTVVTVPASFQAAQRLDTINAARMAGLELGDGELLDEPVAAFLDFVVSYPEQVGDRLDKAKSLVVFDFGGGTCDIAVFRLERQPRSGRIAVAPLAVSRYHRLGGGDIDAAIVHEVLIPQIETQNGLEKFSLTFEEKKKLIEPVFLGVAESLKVGLCTEIARLRSFGKYDEADRETIVKVQPGVQICPLPGRTLTLSSPKLTAADLDRVLEPFLDRDLTFAKETEYVQMCSIFAPLDDALDSARIERADVDLCLMVGGSSLIPQVVDAVKDYFAEARHLVYPNRDSIQTSVARGAAYHALALALFGNGLVQAVCHERIAIRTAKGGSVELVPAGVSLPFPASGDYARCDELAVPETTIQGEVKLRVELTGGVGGKTHNLFTDVWAIRGPVQNGAPLVLEYRCDSNQALTFRLTLADADDGRAFERTIENPLTHVVNPNKDRLKIDELEEDLRTGKVAKASIPDKFHELGKMYADLGQREKALEYYKRALLAAPTPSADILNRMGIVAGEMGDSVREEKFYREAAKHTKWSGPLFNLALAFKKSGRDDDALKTVEEAIDRERDGPSLVLRIELADKTGDSSGRDRRIAEAFGAFNPLQSQDAWELGWYSRLCTLSNDADRMAAVEDERKRRRITVTDVSEDHYPIIRPGIRKAGE